MKNNNWVDIESVDQYCILGNDGEARYGDFNGFLGIHLVLTSSSQTHKQY